MTSYVALLHSIVLNDGRRVAMDPLREMAAALGLANPRTLLATGNLIFDAARTDPHRLEARLEEAFTADFGKPVDIIVLSGEVWRDLVRGNPFPQESARQGSQVAVRVMRAPLSAEAHALLLSRATENESVKVVGGHPWIYFSGRISGTALASAMTPRHIGIGTSRNWNTVRKIDAALAERT